ncbi:uncharacterized protein LOC116931790, partial [Daphnia magna]
YVPSRVTDRPAFISIDVDSIDPTINPPVGQQINHSESESYPEEDLGQEDYCPLNIAEEHLPNTSSQPAILDVSQCNIPIAEEDTTLEQTVPTKTHVSPSDLRPYPRVSQDPTSMLPKKKKRSGRSRVLTDTPEKDQIEVEHNKKVEKESQRLKRCLLKEIQVNNKRNTTYSKPAAVEKRHRQRKEPQDNVNNKENDTHVNKNCDEPPVSCTTRSGRVSRRKVINDV